MKVKGEENLQHWPCKSSHRITVSLDDVKPLTVTLPYPILPDTFKATLHQKDGIVELIAAKALNDLWPEDVIPNQYRWNAENLERFTDIRVVFNHLTSQFRHSFHENFGAPPLDPLNRIRSFISCIFASVLKEKKTFIEVRSLGPLEIKEWLIRAHLPVRISPRGAPLLLLSALDQRQVADQTPQGQGKLKRILLDGEVSKRFTAHFLTDEDAQLWRYILRFNSTKIQPTPWQKKNLPQGGDSPWLATFIRPLYLDGKFHYQETTTPAGACLHCRKLDAQMKQCSRCHSAPYCSVECQRADWPVHKPTCSKP